MSELHRCFAPVWTTRLLFSCLVAFAVGSGDGSQTANTAAAVERRQDSIQHVYSTRFDGVTWDQSNWRLTTTNLDQGHYEARMTVANGYHGINVANLGPFFEADTPVDGDDVNGWPLFGRRQTFATVGGFWDSQPNTNGSNFPWLYQYGWDTAISGIPHWGGIILDLGGSSFLDASTRSSSISSFTSTLDMKTGLMSWAFIWQPQEDASFNISYQMFAHKLHINQGFVSMNVTASQDTNATIANVLNGDCAVRTKPGSKGVDEDNIYTSVQPNGIHNVSAFVYASLASSGAGVTSTQSGTLRRPYVGGNQSSIASGLHVSFQSGQTATFTKYIGIASSDGYSHPRQVAKNAAVAARSSGYVASLSTHMAEWASYFPTTAVDDFAYRENGSLPDDPYIIEAAILSVANPYYILQNTMSPNATTPVTELAINSHSVAVGGLGSDSYAGQIFWDAETWMQPGIVAAVPAAAKGIANYRRARYSQAQSNVKTAYQSSKKDVAFSKNAAIFPWTSGRFGNCTATGPCFDYEYHINGDIAQEMANYWVVTGDTAFFQDDLFPIYDSVAVMFSELLQKNRSHWSLTNATDPDEFANHVDNAAFTMALMSNTLDYANFFRGLFNQTPNATWTSQAESVLIGRDEDANVLLEYTGMNGSISVKQADVVLVTYPLSYTGENYTENDSQSDLDYYAAKQSQDGPGMTYSIFSIIANQISPSGCSAYTYQQYSYHPYVRAPWFQFSEQLLDDFQINGGFHPAFPFLTGHGGANQVVLFGYLGLRLLPKSFSLHVNPSIPPQIPQIRYRTFYWHGWPISAFSNQTHTTLTRNSSTPLAAGVVPNTTFTSSPIPVVVGAVGSSNAKTYSLPPSSSVTIPNRLYSQIKRTPNNIAQCEPVTSTSSFLPGQFPLGAVDGARSTTWQPTYANETASITVSIPPGLKVVGLGFDWAQAPPYNYSIHFSNTSSALGTLVHKSDVRISKPLNETQIVSVVPVQTNTTYFNLSAVQEVYTAKYATLSVWGSWHNGSLNKGNMSGDGATVAEWELIVKDDGVSAGETVVKRRMGSEEERWLGLVGRYNQERRRRGL